MLRVFKLINMFLIAKSVLILYVCICDIYENVHVFVQSCESTYEWMGAQAGLMSARKFFYCTLVFKTGSLTEPRYHELARLTDQ